MEKSNKSALKTIIEMMAAEAHKLVESVLPAQRIRTIFDF